MTVSDSGAQSLDSKQPLEKAPLFKQPRERFLEIRGSVSRNESFVLGILGVVALFGIWEILHYLTPESRQKFLPSEQDRLGFPT